MFSVSYVNLQLEFSGRFVVAQCQVLHLNFFVSIFITTSLQVGSHSFKKSLREMELNDLSSLSSTCIVLTDNGQDGVDRYSDGVW